MFHGLLALLDDIALLVKAAAAQTDDVAMIAGKATSKAAGVVIDDAAVTPGYVAGLHPDRELPIIWQIAKGSLRNKLLLLLPAALLLSWLMPWAITPILICGGTFLAFEGVEKLLKVLGLGHEHKEEAAQDPTHLELSRVRGAITTDLILSAEIMAITLAAVAEETPSIAIQGVVLAVVAVGMTVVVYGLVALIVRADEAGLSLMQSESSAMQSLGRTIVHSMPTVMVALSNIGMVAMLWVGGGIIVHGTYELGVPALHHLIHGAAHSASHALPFAGGAVEWLVTALGSAIVALIVGTLVVVVIQFVVSPLWSRVRGQESH